MKIIFLSLKQFLPFFDLLQNKKKSDTWSRFSWMNLEGIDCGSSKCAFRSQLTYYWCLRQEDYKIIEPRHEKTCLRDFPTRPDTNRPVQPQKLARVLKFRLEILYYLSSEQQRHWSDCTDAQAVLRLCCSHMTGWPLVREKSGKFDFSSRSGKSQGILQIGQGNFKYQESQGKVREFHNFAPKYVL